MDFDGLERGLDSHTTGSSQPFRHLLKRAHRAYAGRDYETAQRILEALAQAVPDSTSILYPLACALYHMGRFHESLELSNRLDRLGDTRARLLRERLNSVRAKDPAAWELIAAQREAAQAALGSEHDAHEPDHRVMRVHVSGPPEDTLALMRVARLYDINYAFCDAMASGVVPIHITDNVDACLACVDRERGVRISTHQREGICSYAGLDNGTYTLLCALIGTAQWRTLALNPLLIGEDFHHGPICSCLFSHQACKENFALVLEQPEICPSCVAFYRCLGVERDIDTLLGFTKMIGTALSPLDSSSLA